MTAPRNASVLLDSNSGVTFDCELDQAVSSATDFLFIKVQRSADPGEDRRAYADPGAGPGRIEGRLKE